MKSSNAELSDTLRSIEVLVPCSDHKYRTTNLELEKVVFNQRTWIYSEYYGDEYLEEGDVVIERYVAR